MAKLTHKQLRELAEIQRYLMEIQQFIFDPRYAVAARKSQATTTLDYVDPDGKALYEIEKTRGCELAKLPDAVNRITKFISDNA